MNPAAWSGERGGQRDGQRITRVEWARLTGRRPRANGSNARLGDHGVEVLPPIARITTSDGLTGFGWARIDKSDARRFVGRRLDDAFRPDGTSVVIPEFRALEYPILDLAARRAGKPVYRFVASDREIRSPFRVRCYDTSLYIDDLGVADNREAAALIASEAMEGFDRGHRGFKIKVGRGGMHMDLEEGTRRDILVIKAVRAAVGRTARIMIDANNGYNLNLTKRVLEEIAEENLYWVEEPFHEDPMLYRNLRAWMTDRGLNVLIADGEGNAAGGLDDWAKEGLVDVLQYDIRSPGFSAWLERGPVFDDSGIRSAPHHYGGYFGNYAAGHLSAAIRRFEAVEWDETDVPGLCAPGYRIHDGWLSIPDTPGFGLELDEQVYWRAVDQNGYRVEE
jgi:L-rhamnonate dehydratase